MTGKERIEALFNRKPADRVGFWLGNPADETKEIYSKALGLGNMHDQIKNETDLKLRTGKAFEFEIELHTKFQSDFFWAYPGQDPQLYIHPEGKPMFDVYGGKPQESLSQPGIFAECEDVKEVENFDWPNPDYLNYDQTVKTVEAAAKRGMSVFGGMWMPFFHIVADFFGMENYFIKMHTNPEVVEAVTEKVVDFYLEANRRCLDLISDKLTAQFFGNDLGSQLNLLISPDKFKKFVYPGFKKIADQAKSYNLKVVLHSCGSVHDLIPQYISAGIDGLHPLQAKASNMDAERLAREFKNDLVFIGGVDTQHLLPFCSPLEVKAEVKRLKKVFGERFVVSPSHEALLPNVSIENALAMRDTALE
jgi:uroporphyrinogen decarboxylase